MVVSELAFLAAFGALTEFAVPRLSTALQDQLVVDSLAHAAVSSATWVTARHLDRHEVCATFDSLAEAALAAVVGSLVDVDHFIAARSFSLHAATHLRQRPFGHSLIFVFALPAALLRARVVSLRIAILVATAIAAHQARDALRRGLWLARDWHSRPLSHCAYLFLLVFLSLIAATTLRTCVHHKNTSSRENTTTLPLVHHTV